MPCTKQNFFDRRAHGFARIVAAKSKVRTADITYNTNALLEVMAGAHRAEADVLICPELCLSSYDLGDVVMQDALLDSVEDGIAELVSASAGLPMLCAIGAPLRRAGRLYNCAVVYGDGRVLGIVPKSYLPNYREYYEKRWFASGLGIVGETIDLCGEAVPVGTDLIFTRPDIPGFALFAEICEDFWAPIPPSTYAAMAGASVLANLSASNVTIGKADERAMLVRTQSSRAIAAYAYCAAGHGESTTDLAWDGQAMIYEIGDKLASSERFSHDNMLCIADVDCQRIMAERRRNQTFGDCADFELGGIGNFREVKFAPDAAAARSKDTAQRGSIQPGSLMRPIRRFPFVPNRKNHLDEDCYEAFNIQIDGLTRRIEATHAESLVIGISGGLDSTHALIVAAKACDALSLPRSFIRGYTMPGFGTSDNTKNNAHALMNAMGITAEELDIRPAAERMLKDIGHAFADGEPVYDTTFENVQAGLRTDYLFRLAGQHKGFVVGTGDLSEMALGWCTYGVGDQMSHYAVNSGVPKTLIQYLIYWAISSGQFDEATGAVLQEVLATDISPELVPVGADGAIQSTEAIVGPYALNDFFLHHIMRYGKSPANVAFLAWQAWGNKDAGMWPVDFPEAAKGEYDLATIKHWLANFLRRFFALSQYKRSAIPNGPKVSSGGALSPRGDWRAPSDAVADLWLAELEECVPDKVRD